MLVIQGRSAPARWPCIMKRVFLWARKFEAFIVEGFVAEISCAKKVKQPAKTRMWLFHLCILIKARVLQWLRHSSRPGRDGSYFSFLNCLFRGNQLIISTNASLPLVNWTNDTGIFCTMLCNMLVQHAMEAQDFIKLGHRNAKIASSERYYVVDFELYLFFFLFPFEDKTFIFSFIFYGKAHQAYKFRDCRYFGVSWERRYYFLFMKFWVLALTYFCYGFVDLKGGCHALLSRHLTFSERLIC